MKVLVLGAGVIGVTCAHYLAEGGHEVTVVDRQRGPALETSLANAGIVCPSYATPWAAPGMRWKAFKWLLQRNAPMKVNWPADEKLLGWMKAWLANCNRARFERNKRRMQRLSRYSLACLQQLRDATGIRYDEIRQGSLQLLRTSGELAAISSHTRMLEQAGIPHQVLSAKGCIDVEPALADARLPFAGGVHLPLDETGDCHRFTTALVEHARQRDVRFLFQIAVQHLRVTGDRISEALTSDEPLSADAFVVALGCDSVTLLDTLEIKLPIQPVKGYSATLQITRPDRAPRAAVIDEHNKIAITRLGDRVRAAGRAELGANTTYPSASACRALVGALRELFPRAADFGHPEYWAGLRPMTPDGPPILGRTPIGNLFLNVGHGSQGWSMACGSARVVADLVSNREPAIDLEGLTLERYG
jgi:D-amino-acid dehydrogenase